MIYEKGDAVVVTIPGGELEGRVMEIMPCYGFSGSREIKYRVDGADFTTITSERCIRAVKLARRDNQ